MLGLVFHQEEVLQMVIKEEWGRGRVSLGLQMQQALDYQKMHNCSHAEEYNHGEEVRQEQFALVNEIQNLLEHLRS